MTKPPPSRALARDRHGRGIRRPLLSKLFSHGQTRLSGFEQIVAATCEFLSAEWPEELAELSWVVQDAPPITRDSNRVRRWSLRRENHTIVLYRLPIERFTKDRRTDAISNRMRIEHYVFEAVGALIDKDPWDLIPDRHR